MSRTLDNPEFNNLEPQLLRPLSVFKAIGARDRSSDSSMILE
jgi:hypothetical protein